MNGGEFAAASGKVYVEAASGAELLAVLSMKRVVVPPLGHGKRTSAVEEWTMRRFFGDVLKQRRVRLPHACGPGASDLIFSFTAD